ncbi:hypothetical protein H4R34_003084 [Dimargaris verticillata]|uniref:HCP-like protein n=1 Tax=Dimargaris verticillata TaxID=2761393 RepID=A0A9W8B2V1_9FUNG|nr:hypothetical protein H4R34_003084 [Dimargaris verticillata]
MGWKKFLPPAIKTRWRDSPDSVSSTANCMVAAADTGLVHPPNHGPLPAADDHLQPPKPPQAMPASATLPRPSPMDRPLGWRQKYLSWLPQDSQVVQQILGTKAPVNAKDSSQGSPPQLPPRPSRYSTARARREGLGSKTSPNFHRSHLDLAAAHEQLFTIPAHANSTQSLPIDTWPRPLFGPGPESPVSPTLRVPILMSEEEPLEPPTSLFDKPMDDEARRMSFVRLLDHCPGPGPASPEMRRSRTSSSVSIDSAQSDMMSGRFIASSPLARCSYSAHDSAMGELIDATTSPSDSDKRSSLRNGWEGLKTWSHGVRQRTSLASVTPTESRPRLPLRLDARYHTWLRDGTKERAKKLRNQVEKLLERPLSYVRPASTVNLASPSPTRAANTLASDAQPPPGASFTLTSMTCVTSPLLNQLHSPSQELEPPSRSFGLPNRRSSLTVSSLPLVPPNVDSDIDRTHGLALGIASTAIQSPGRVSPSTGTPPRQISSESMADDTMGSTPPTARPEPPFLPTRTSSLHSIRSTRSIITPLCDAGPRTPGSSQTPRSSIPSPTPLPPSDSGTDLAALPPTISTLSAMHDPVEDHALLSTPIPKPFAHQDTALPVDHVPPRFPRLNTKNLRLATPTTRSPTSPLSLSTTSPNTPSLRQSPTSRRPSTTPRSVSTPTSRPWWNRPLSPDGGGSLSAVLPLLNPTPNDVHPPLPPLSPPLPAASVPISGQAKDWRSGGSTLTIRPPPLSSSPRNSSELGLSLAIPEPDDHLARRPSYPLPLHALPHGDGALSQALMTTESADECMQRALAAQDRGDITKATLLFRQAALQGSSIGLFFYGLSLRHGWGCKANPDFGFQCLQKAVSYALHELKAGIEGVAQTSIAKQELTIALYELAVCYQNGWGVTTNAEAAAFYFEIAANLGDPDAQNDIAFCYMNGKGVPVDKALAAKYFRMADKQGAGIVGNSWIFKSKYTEGSRLPI